jgi:hypothetical protein
MLRSGGEAPAKAPRPTRSAWTWTCGATGPVPPISTAKRTGAGAVGLIGDGNGEGVVLVRALRGLGQGALQGGEVVTVLCKRGFIVSGATGTGDWVQGRGSACGCQRA